MLWDELIEDTGFTLPADATLALAAYIGGIGPEAFVELRAVGTTLPDVPLFLTPEIYVPIPLEATYNTAYDGLPAFWRGVLERPT